jgi:hypothetical protein
MSPTTFYALVKEGELSLVKITLRSAAAHSSTQKNSTISSAVGSGARVPKRRIAAPCNTPPGKPPPLGDGGWS